MQAGYKKTVFVNNHMSFYPFNLFVTVDAV
jgi:hypothetical protein